MDENESKPLHIIARCSHCNAYLFEAEMTMDQPVVGPIVTVKNFKCKKCKNECTAVLSVGDAEIIKEDQT